MSVSFPVASIKLEKHKQHWYNQNYEGLE